MPISPPRQTKTTPVTNPQAAELLANPDTGRFLKPFMRGEHTIKQAAAELNVSLEYLHYRVRRFEQADLLQVVRTEPRRGRPSKVYRATSTHYHIPAKLLKPETLQALLEGQAWQQEIHAATTRHLIQTPAGVTLHLDQKGTLEWGYDFPNLTDEPPSTPGLLQLRSAALYLDPSDAAAFADELYELHQRYQHKRGSKRYGLLLNLVPLDRPVD